MRVIFILSKTGYRNPGILLKVIEKWLDEINQGFVNLTNAPLNSVSFKKDNAQFKTKQKN